MLLNAALLFMVLFYIYPLKFLFSLINVQWILNMPSQETIRLFFRKKCVCTIINMFELSITIW